MSKALRVRRGVCAATTLVLVGQWLLVAPTAEASASGCTGGAGFGPRNSCVQVNGGGVHVDWARGGVHLPARDNAAGYFELFAADFTHRSEDHVYDNRSFRRQTEWGAQVPINRDFPHGTKVCAAFMEGNGDGTYKRHDPACVKITR